MFIDLVTYECWVCGVPFGFSRNLDSVLRESGGPFFCPKGCRLAFGESAVSKLQREKIREQNALQAKLNEANHAKLVAERARDAAIKEKRKVERRVAHGVCPCCNKTFADLSNHMVTEHKEFRLPVGKKPKEITGTVQ